MLLSDADPAWESGVRRAELPDEDEPLAATADGALRLDAASQDFGRPCQWLGFLCRSALQNRDAAYRQERDGQLKRGRATSDGSDGRALGLLAKARIPRGVLGPG